VADKKGSEGIEGWAHPLAERFGDQIEIAGLADVSSVPGALRGLVRSKFKKAIQYPVMLDWDGDATQSFKYTRGKANVYLIAPDGRVLEHMYGEADAAAVNRLADQIKSLMTNTPQAQSALMQRPAPIDAECRRVRPRPGG
jgi:hypothetical protein